MVSDHSRDSYVHFLNYFAKQEPPELCMGARPSSKAVFVRNQPLQYLKVAQLNFL